MSASFFYHALGLRDYQYLKTEYKKRQIYFHVKKYFHQLRYPDCGSSNLILRGFKKRSFKSVSIGRKRIILVVKIKRLQYRDCHCLKQEKLHFADPKKTYTRAFARFVLDLLQSMTIDDAARHLGVCWDTVKDIQKQYLQKHFARPQLDQLQHIAIDEISIGRKHRYLTLVLDLASGAVVFIGNGKGADTLKPFWDTLKNSGTQIKAVAMDMSVAYIQAVRENLPEAAIVFDHFHIIKLCTINSQNCAVNYLIKRPVSEKVKFSKESDGFCLKILTTSMNPKRKNHGLNAPQKSTTTA